ncbi:MAG: SulP family inorganic anion transporter [Chlamydiales bacterium]|nr:SulP family inorganic anion transporter [Chlamydiales bacterium]
MTIQAIDPYPFWNDLKGYQFKFLRGDCVAALSVGLMALPQAMAYAFLAGLPTSMGVWSVVFGTIFTAAFGQSRFLVSGTTNIIAILIQSGTSEILHTYYPGIWGLERDILAKNIVVEIVLLIGVFQVLAGLLRLGRLTQFISRSVIIGYIAGAALAIAVTQLFPFFGIKEFEGYHPIYNKAWLLIGQLYHLHIPTTLLSIGCLFVLIFLYRLSQKIPGAAIVFILAGSFVALFNLAPENAKSAFEVAHGEAIERVTLVQDLGPVFQDFPRFAAPYFEFRLLANIIPLALAIALLSVIEATSLGRHYTSSKEPPYNDNQEIYGLGISNFLSAFFSAMPSSGSFSRSALNKAAGAHSRFSAMISGAFVFLFVATLGFLVNKIPIAALSALMIFTAYTMLNLKHFFICLRATRGDAFALLATLASSIFFTLDIALYIGVALSIVLYLKRAAVPFLVEYAFNNVGKLRPLEAEEERPDPRICIVQAEGELFFGAADLLQTKLRNISEDEEIKVVILQLLNTRYIDASICLALRQVLSYLNGTGRKLILSGVSDEVWKVLEESGLLRKIGEENVFRANEQLPSEPTRSAYKLAKESI